MSGQIVSEREIDCNEAMSAQLFNTREYEWASIDRRKCKSDVYPRKSVIIPKYWNKKENPVLDNGDYSRITSRELPLLSVLPPIVEIAEVYPINHNLQFDTQIIGIYIYIYYVYGG